MAVKVGCAFVSMLTFVLLFKCDVVPGYFFLVHNREYTILRGDLYALYVCDNQVYYG